MKKRLIYQTTTLVFLLIFSQINFASAATNSLKLNINGVSITDQEPIMVNSTTMVPIRTITLLPNFSVNWNNQTKTVTVTNKSENKTVKLIVGEETAIVNNQSVSLSTPVRLVKGTTYIPFRFIGESLDAEVSWDQSSQTVVIYTTDSDVIEAYQGLNLVNSRIAALELPRINLNNPLFTSDEGHSTSYYFPTGKSRQFFIANQGVVQYYEVKNNAAWKVWEAKEGGSSTKAIIPGVITSMEKEWGTRPTYKGQLSYFTDLWMEGKVNYGIVDATGKTKQLGSENSIPDNPVVKEIPQDNVKK